MSQEGAGAQLGVECAHMYNMPHPGCKNWGNSIPYSGKLLREKTFANFAVLWLFTKVFSAKFGGIVSFVRHKQAGCESFFPRKSYFSPIQFSPSKVSVYRLVCDSVRW